MRFFVISLFTLCFSQTFALQNCELIAENSKLTAKKPTLYLIHNKFSAKLWLTHPLKYQSANAGWSSQIAKDRWSAIKITQDFLVRCIESAPGHEQVIPCNKALEVCELSDFDFSKSQQGAYWVGENMKLDALLKHIENRGFKKIVKK